MLVYKYRGGNEKVFERDLDSLIQNSFWFAKLNELNDPMEGTVDSETFKKQVHNLITNSGRGENQSKT